MESLENFQEKQTPLEELDMSIKTLHYLKSFVKVNTIEELSNKTEAELRSVPTLGERIINEIKDILKEEGKTLRED